MKEEERGYRGNRMKRKEVEGERGEEEERGKSAGKGMEKGEEKGNIK